MVTRMRRSLLVVRSAPVDAGQHAARVDDRLDRLAHGLGLRAVLQTERLAQRVDVELVVVRLIALGRTGAGVAHLAEAVLALLEGARVGVVRQAAEPGGDSPRRPVD